MQSKRFSRMCTAWPRLYLLVGSLLVSGLGCETSNRLGEGQVSTAAGQSDNHGYALLAELCGDEKDVSKLRLLKRERPELKALLQEIASTNRVALEALQRFAKADPSLDLKDRGLPIAEVATRKAISKTKQKAILGSKGKDLELQLLLDQNEAITYGSHLAGVVALSESNPQRRQFLDQLARALGVLQQRVLEMLASGYLAG